MLQELPLSDPWVQDMLWALSNPQHVRWDYTKLAMMKYFETSWLAGDTIFVGDKEKDVLLRCEIYNPKVIAVHICGNGKAIRGVLKEGVVKAFREYKFDIVELWSMDERLVRIQEKAGFTVVAQVAKRIYVDGQMQDLTVMHYTRSDYERDCRLSYRRLHEGSPQTPSGDT